MLNPTISALVKKTASKHNLPADLLGRQVEVESSGNPAARGPGGELGLMQISKPLAADYALNEAALLDAETNLDVGAGHLRSLLNQIAAKVGALDPLQVYRLALWAYNGGIGYILRAVSMLTEQRSEVNAATVARVLPFAAVSGKTIRSADVQRYADKIMGTAAAPSPALASAQKGGSFTKLLIGCLIALAVGLALRK